MALFIFCVQVAHLQACKLHLPLPCLLYLTSNKLYHNGSIQQHGVLLPSRETQNSYKTEWIFGFPSPASSVFNTAANKMVLTVEYRIPLPLTVEEYRIAQLYMLAVSPGHLRPQQSHPHFQSSKYCSLTIYWQPVTVRVSGGNPQVVEAQVVCCHRNITRTV